MTTAINIVSWTVITFLCVVYAIATVKATNRIADATRWQLLDRLRGNNNRSITRFSISYSTNGEIWLEICADWTNQKWECFKAATIDVCLAQAIRSMEQRNHG